MKLPRMVGLVGPAPGNPEPEPADSGNPLDQLGAEDFEALQLLAEEAAAAGELGEELQQELAETAAEEAAESQQEQATEHAAGVELHDAPTLATMALSMAEEAASAVAQLQALQEQAEQVEGGDPKAVAKALKEAEGLAEDCAKAAEAAAKAADKDDVGAAAEAAAECEELHGQILQLVAEAEGAAQGEPAEESGGPAPAPKQPKPALQQWAERAR